jgi:hypothetical protein
METVVAVVACPSVVIAPVDIAVVVCDWEVDAVGGGNVVVDVVVATTGLIHALTNRFCTVMVLSGDAAVKVMYRRSAVTGSSKCKFNISIVGSVIFWPGETFPLVDPELSK